MSALWQGAHSRHLNRRVGRQARRGIVELLKQPNGWSCFPTSLAMLLGHSIKEVIEGIGHDGSEIIWPNLKDPFRRRCFHVQEICHYALQSGFALGQYDLAPASAPSFEVEPFTISGQGNIIADLMQKYEGIVLGYGHARMHHVVAWDREQIFDPNGTTYCISKFMPTVFMPLLSLSL